MKESKSEILIKMFKREIEKGGGEKKWLTGS